MAKGESVFCSRDIVSSYTLGDLIFLLLTNQICQKGADNHTSKLRHLKME